MAGTRHEDRRLYFRTIAITVPMVFLLRPLVLFQLQFDKIKIRRPEWRRNVTRASDVRVVDNVCLNVSIL